MTLIERWTIEGRDEYERTLTNVAGPTIPARAQRSMVLESNYEALAQQLAGAVDALRRIVDEAASGRIITLHGAVQIAQASLNDDAGGSRP